MHNRGWQEGFRAAKGYPVIFTLWYIGDGRSSYNVECILIIRRL